LLHPLQQTRTRQVRRASRGSRPVVEVALEVALVVALVVDSPKPVAEQRAGRLAATMVWRERGVWSVSFFFDQVDPSYSNTSSL